MTNITPADELIARARPLLDAEGARQLRAVLSTRPGMGYLAKADSGIVYAAATGVLQEMLRHLIGEYERVTRDA